MRSVGAQSKLNCPPVVSTVIFMLGGVHLFASLRWLLFQRLLAPALDGPPSKADAITLPCRLITSRCPTERARCGNSRGGMPRIWAGEPAAPPSRPSLTPLTRRKQSSKAQAVEARRQIGAGGGPCCGLAGIPVSSPAAHG